MNKLSLEKDSKLVEKENILRNLNNLIEEKEKTIKENANLYFNNPLIKNCHFKIKDSGLICQA